MRYAKILSVLILALLCGCRKETSPASTVVSVNIAVTPATRTDDPDEVKISDLNIFIFDAGGHLEESAYIDSHMNGGEARYSFHGSGKPTAGYLPALIWGSGLPASARSKT